MNSPRALAVTALAALLLLALGLAGLRTPWLSLQAVPFGQPMDPGATTLRIHFAAADRASPGAEVRYGQAVVGRVTSVATDGVDALVTARLDTTIPIPADVFAELRLPTALGTPFVALTPGQDTGAAVLDGEVELGRDRTGVGPDLESALGSVGLLLNGSGIEQLDTVMDELTVALAGRGQDLDGIRDRTERAAGLYADHGDEIDRTVDAMTTLTDALVSRQDLLDRGMRSSATVLTEAAQSRDRIAGLLQSSNSLVTEADTFLAGTDGKITPTVSTLQTVVADLAAFNDRVGPTLEALNAFVDVFDPAIKGDNLLFDGALDVPGSLDALNTDGKARNGQDGVQEIPVPQIPPLPGLRTGPVDPRPDSPAAGGAP